MKHNRAANISEEVPHGYKIYKLIDESLFVFDSYEQLEEDDTAFVLMPEGSSYEDFFNVMTSVFDED